MSVRHIVAVDGIDELRRSLRELSPAAARGLRVGLNEVSDYLIGKITPKIPARSGKARRSLKKRSTQAAVRIAVGGRAAPYYPWLDWGGKVGPRKSVSRPYQGDGRYVYPTLKEERPAIESMLEEVLDRISRDAGLEPD